MLLQKFKNRLRHYYSLIIGRSLELKRNVKIEAVWYGNEYGGFYVYPSLLNNNSIVYSFGIGEDISFDREVMIKHSCSVYAFDPTPKSILWVNSQKITSNFFFYPFGLSVKTGLETFYLPKNNAYVSGSTLSLQNVDTLEPISVPMKKFSDIVLELNHHTIDVLKMDIEGSEYAVLNDILTSSVIIKQICIEFHHRMFKNGASKTRESIRLLKENGFELFAFSDANEELSFINIKYV